METKNIPLLAFLQTMNRSNIENTSSSGNSKMANINRGQHQKIIPTSSLKLAAPMTRPTRKKNGSIEKGTTRKRRVRFHKEEEDGGTTMTQQQQQHAQDNDSSTQQKMTVTTSTACRTMLIPPLLETLTEEVCNRLWFQNSEIAAFRAETRKLILHGKQSPEDDLAGLERFSLERSTRKKSAIRLVLLAQLKCKSILSANVENDGNTATTTTEFIESIASECAEWAVTAGMLQGFQDFLQVYDPLTSLLGANKKEGATYNDSLFGNDINGFSYGEDIILNNKRKSRDFDTSIAAAATLPQSQMMGLMIPGSSADDLSSSLGGGRRVQQRIQ
jgi:hypothetical protein